MHLHFDCYLNSSLPAFDRTHLNNFLPDLGEWNIKRNLAPSFAHKYTADGDKASPLGLDTQKGSKKSHENNIIFVSILT